MEGGDGLEARHVAAIGGQVAQALDDDHAAGVVHRAVEPVNVLLEGDRAHLFGGASGRPSDPTHTAPEVLAGKQPTPATDVYGLAAVLFEALTGRPPARRTPSLRELRPDLPQALEDAITAGLARDPDRRPATAGDLMRSVRRAIGEDEHAMTASTAAAPPTGLGARVKRAAVLAAMALTAVNIWTGSPLLALWIGSRIQGNRGVSMGALFAVIGCLALTSFALLRLLGILGAAYDDLTGRRPEPRRQQPWLRSLSGERLSEQRRRERVSALDAVLVGTVLLAAGAFEIWFFFFSGSSI